MYKNIQNTILVSLCGLLVAYGFKVSIDNYYYSSYQFVYWILCALLLVLFGISRAYTIKIALLPSVAVFAVVGLYITSWLLVPHFLRFGIFPFATLCFVYSAASLYNSDSKIIKSLCLVTYTISAINISAILFYFAEKSLITRAIINTLFISNSNETLEYLYGKISLHHILLLTLFIFLSLMIFLVKTDKKNDIKISFPMLSFFILSFLLSSFSSPLGAVASEYIVFLHDKSVMKVMLDDRLRGKAATSFTVELPNNEAKKVMIIIGESLNREFMSLYGYPKNTTPNLLTMANDSTKGKLFYFTDVISPETTTIPALRKVLTNINNENNIPFEKSVTIVDLFQKAGYATFWLSNQAPLGKHDTPNAIIAATANKTYFTASKNSIKNSNASSGNYFDDSLLQIFKSYSNSKEKKQVFFLHLMGSHFYYNDRYPNKFDIFKSKNNGDVNSYLNTVYYNDWVVSNLMQSAISKQFDVICYFSDHGEDMEKQHNQENYRRGMSKIPLMVYLSNDFIKTHLHLKDQLKQHKKTPAMTDNFFHDIQTICGFRSSLFDPKLSFLSEEYIIRKRKVVDNKIPFD